MKLSCFILHIFFLFSGAWVSAPSSLPSVWGFGVLGGGADGLCSSLCYTLLSPAALLFSEAFWSLHLSWPPCQLGSFPGHGFLSSFTAPSQDCWSHPDSFLSLSLFFFNPVMWRVSCHFWKFKVVCQLPAFSRCSVQIILHVVFFFFFDVFVGEGKLHSFMSFSFTILIPPLDIYFSI